MGAIASFSSPQRIRLGPGTQVTVETALPFGADPDEEFPAWRATVEHGETRIVVLSDGPAAALFPPAPAPSVLAVSGADPAAAWDLSPAVAFVANAESSMAPTCGRVHHESPTATMGLPRRSGRGATVEIRRRRCRAAVRARPGSGGNAGSRRIIPNAEAAPRVIPKHAGSRRFAA